MTQITIVSDNIDNHITISSSMIVGDAAILLEPKDIEGIIILKTYQGFINLQDPSKTWENDPHFKVQIIKELFISYKI